MSGYKKISGHVNRISIIFFKTNISVHDTKAYQLFAGPIGNEKTTENIVFQPEAPVLEFHQKTSNICCLSGLASDFHSIGDNMDVSALADFIEEQLTLHTDKFSNIIHFANDIITNRMHIKGEQHLRYNLNI